jgi:uncharacterized membrane protein
MNRNLKILTRVATFAALVFVFSYATVLMPNVNLSFFVVFTAGFLWGIWPGIGVGVIGFFLWSNFNPSGPAPFPILLAQLAGISFSAVIGTLMSSWISIRSGNFRVILLLIISGFFCGFMFHLVVSIVDAFVFQPFWPRFLGGLLFSLITLVSNCIIFPLLYPVLDYLYRKEKKSIA